MRAREFVHVTNQLWDSWDEDAIGMDVHSGIFADSTKVHELNHKGKYFSVRGPLNLPRSPQGRPVLVQAGSSEDGKAFAAEFAVWTLSGSCENPAWGLPGLESDSALSYIVK